MNCNLYKFLFKKNGHRKKPKYANLQLIFIINFRDIIKLYFTKMQSLSKEQPLSSIVFTKKNTSECD